MPDKDVIAFLGGVLFVLVGVGVGLYGVIEFSFAKVEVKAKSPRRVPPVVVVVFDIGLIATGLALMYPLVNGLFGAASKDSGTRVFEAEESFSSVVKQDGTVSFFFVETGSGAPALVGLNENDQLPVPKAVYSRPARTMARASA